MASSTLFRGRRIVDPVPVQRGPLPRDGKYRSSFSDLAAAWENVGEVKSALQAAEARINEANAGLSSDVEENEELDVPMQEIFSETQRYGRVARFELRPNRYGQAVTAAAGLGEDRNNPRRAADLPLSTRRPTEVPGRASGHPPRLSPPSKDIHSGVLNGGVSRNPLPTFPAYPSDSGVREPSVTTAYSSVYGTNDQPGCRSPVRLHGSVLSTIPSASSFDDSLEVGGASRLSRNETRPTSSLGLRPTIANNSDALARLKERIKQQKEQASRLSPPNSIPGSSSSNPSPPPERPAVEATAVDAYRVDLDIPVRTAISKRKVASAPAAPAYKGFSEVESKTTVLSEMNRKVKTKGPTAVHLAAKPANQRPQKPQPKKGPPKVQRVIAPRRPTDIITTSSWRTGQQTVKRILGPANKRKTSPEESRPQSSSSEGTDISEPKSLNFQWKEEVYGKKSAVHDDGDGSGKDISPREESPRRTSPVHEEHVNGLRKDSGPSAESEADSDEDVNDLKGNRMLSTEAKNILSDLELDSEDESDKEIKKPVAESKPKHSRVNKPSLASKRKRPLNPQSQVAPQMPTYPKQKMRHYDVDEVKKYMAKQIAERKKKLKEDRLLKEKAVKEKKRKLEELYSKQRKNLQNNLHHKDKKSLGETYSKGRSDNFRSFIYPYNHPFPQDEVEHYSEDTGVSESDKENLDIASFRGLPAYPSAKGGDHHDISSSPSLSSHSMSPVPGQHSENEDRSQVPSVTSVSVGTKPVDTRPSAYAGFPEEKSEGDTEMTRLELGPCSSSPTHPGTVPSAVNGELKPLSSPPREDRIAAIKQTAAQLKQRLETEALRLGLNLPAAGRSNRDEQLPSTTASASDYTVFKGALPGVGSLHEQAELNKELDTMTSAATTIQAAFRGHSVRQGLNWKLPSGRTLRSTVREGLHQRSSMSGAGASESSQYSTAWDTVVPNEDKSSISDINTSYSSGRSNVKSLTHSSRSLKDDRSSSTRTPSLHESQRRRHTAGHLSKRSQGDKPSSRPWNSKGGDSLSVINIFTRRNPHLKLLTREDDVSKEHDSESASLLEETLQENKAGATVSLLDPPAGLDQSRELLEQTLVEESPEKSKEHEYDDDFEASHGRKHEGSEKHTPSPDKKSDDPMYSETFESPDHRTSSPYKEESLLSPNRSVESGALSPTLSEGELSRASEAVGRSPTFSSTRRSPTRDQKTESSVPPFSAPVHPPPSVFMLSHQGGDRLSPGSLDLRLTAELNKLEYMEESVRQLTDVERTRAVSLAQQETVSLAQILKSKQLSHAREMENLRAKAREEALEAAKQLEEARRAAADAAAGAAETIARMRLEAATSITESADRLVKVQSEAARTTAESAKQVEEARSSAAWTLLEVAKQQTADTRGVAAEAASAAAEAAVKSTMSRFYDQQEQTLKEREQLLKERDARLKSYHDRSRDERSRDSYSSYSTSERTDSYSRTRTSRSGTDAVDRDSQAKDSPGTRTYASEEFSRSSEQDKTASIRTASNLTVDRSVSHSRGTPTLSDRKSALAGGDDTGSIPEEMEHSVADSVVSDVGLDVADDDSMAEVLTGDNVKKPSERLERSPEEEDYTLNFEESVISSHTATDDEIDFRMILPSESHRRRSLGKTGRSGSIGSDHGTVSYSSDDNHDSQELPFDKMLEEVSAAPFSAEDSFSQFTSDMVRLMKEEEVRAKHQAGLLRLREKALKEKTRAEMAWLECQKQRHRDKGADDVMPSIRKRQRGVLMRLQAEQAEIKRLKAANRAASYERRLLLMQQEEIARLRKNTKKIREKATTEQVTYGLERGENAKKGEQDLVEQPKSEAESTEIIEEFEDKPADHSTRSRSSVSEDVKTASPSASQTASVAEELPSYQSPGASRSETHPSIGSHGGPGSDERKRALSEGDSDDGSARDGIPSATKESPTASDSTVMQKLKKLKNQSGEKYLTLREQKLMKRRREAENLLEDKKKLLEWEKRLDKEETLVRNLLNEALKLESSRNKGRTASITSEEEDQKDRSGRASTNVSLSRSPSRKTSTKQRSTQGTETISESIKASGSRGHERSASESSVPEDINISARDKSHDSDKSRDSSIPEVDMKTRSQGDSIPEEIPEEYVNDTFESLDSTVTPAHSTPVRSDLSFKRDTSPSVSRRSSNDGSKSEEEASMTETSDHSDIESRVRRLRDQLELRKREVKRLYNERKKQRKAMLRAQEASLRQELQAVEMVISRTKAELNRPQTESKRPETGSIDQQPVSTRSDSSDTTLSRTSDTSRSRKLTSPDKAVTVSARSEPAGGKVSTVVDLELSGRSERTISDVPTFKEKSEDKEKELSTVLETRSPARSELSLDKKAELDRTESTRSPDEPISSSLRQSTEREQTKSVRQQHDSEPEIEDEAKTAEDLSISEGSVVRTASRASYSEEKSRSSSKSLSASRGQMSDSDRKSSVKIPDEAKTAEDLSVSEKSEVFTKTKSSRSESSVSDGEPKCIPKKSKDDVSERSSLLSEKKSIVSEVSKSSRLSKSPLPEKSRSSRPAYSSSFESVESEGDRTEDDISEHISVEEDLKDSETERSGKDEQSIQKRQPERAAVKDVESTKDVSEASDDVSSVKNEKSEIEEELPSTGRSASVLDENSTASQKTEQSLQREKDFLKLDKEEDRLPSYSADFEPSALDETDEGKSDDLMPQASYTPDFDASESNVPEELDKSLQKKDELEDLSGYSKRKDQSEIIKSEKKPAQDKIHREDHVRPEIPTVALEQATDEESVAEELSVNDEAVEELDDKEDSSNFFEKNDFEERFLGSQERTDREVAPVLPDVPAKAVETPEPRDRHADHRTADRIAEDLSAILLTESMNCVASMFEKHRRTVEDVPKTPEAVVKRKEDRTSFEDDEDVFQWLVEKETSEADIISLSGDEGSVSGLDFIPESRVQEDFVPSHVEEPRQDLPVEGQARKEQGDSMVNKLSDSLLKEAASQMIAIMRAKQAKLAKAQKEQSTDSPSPPRGTTEEEPHSGEESPLSSPRSNRFMAVQRFPDGVSKYLEDTSTPPGSPTDERRSSIDEKELAEKLDQLRRLHEHLDSAREKLVKDDDDDDSRLEFTVHTNELIEFPTEEEDEEEEITRRSRAASFLFSVPHCPSQVTPVVASSLSFYFDRKRRGLPIDMVSPPSEIIGEDEADDDLEANSKRVYRRLLFDLSGNVLKELISEEAPSNRLSWMKAKPRRKRRFHRGLQPLIHEKDYLPVVEQQVLNLVGLGDARPSLDRVRRKTPLKAGKKDFVDAILIQELREDEPLWIDYDDDELAVKFQVADAIFESLLSETVMVVNAVQMRREAREDVIRS